MPPKLEAFNGHYAKYATAYKQYLDLVEDFNGKVTLDSKVKPVDQDTIKINISNNVVTINGVSSALVDGQVLEHRPTGGLGAVATDLSASSTNTRQTMQNTHDKVEKFRRNVPISTDTRLTHLFEVSLQEHRGQLKPDARPTPENLRHGLSDIYTPAALQLLVDRGRVPKTFRSLFNLREMSMRKLQKSPGHLLTELDVMRLREGSEGRPLPRNP